MTLNRDAGQYCWEYIGLQKEQTIQCNHGQFLNGGNVEQIRKNVSVSIWFSQRNIFFPHEEETWSGKMTSAPASAVI